MGGADGARAALDAYWRRVSRAAAFSPLQRSPLERMMGRWTLDASPLYLAMDLMSRVFSPYTSTPWASTRFAKCWQKVSISSAWQHLRSSCLSPPQTCTPA